MNAKKFFAQLFVAAVSMLLSVTVVAQQTAEPVNAITNANAKTTTMTKSASTEAAETVVIESTITGNQEQPKTIYVLPWQDSVARIKMPAAEKPKTENATKPLDREQFLRFIQAQPLLAPTSGQQPMAGQAEVPEHTNQ
jgi:hypothetical protein